MKNKLAVIISDIHFNLNNLELASESLKAAIDKSNEFQVPLVIAGDLNDTKAIIRAEVANRLIELLDHARQEVYILEGNHDKINEKGIGHGLNYLWPYAKIIDKVEIIEGKFILIPYHSDLNALKTTLKTLPRGYPLIMHQGFRGAFMGDYIQDHSSIDVDEVKDFRVFSGHYHRHQTLGTVTYIGSPYTITFGEANDGPKGFLSINLTGTFEQHVLELRRHIIVEDEVNNMTYSPLKFLRNNLKKDDLLWVKLKGTRSELDKITKQDLAKKYDLSMTFRLDKVCVDELQDEEKTQSNLSDKQIMDNIIDNLNDSEEHKALLKSTWRELLE